MNIFILDLETSGLDSSKHEILSIGAVNTATDETFEVKVHPLHIKDADPIALKVNGYNEKDWEEAFLLPHALQLLSEFVGAGAPRMMTYNCSFDRSFLEKAYRDCKLEYPFHYQHLDLFSIVYFACPKIPCFTLSEVCKHLGIEPEPAIHSALNGAQKAHEVYKYIKIFALSSPLM